MPDSAAAAPLEPPALGGPDRQALAEDLVDAALAALRQGALDALVAQRPLAARWLMRRWRPLLRGTAGDALGPNGDLGTEAAWLLRWGMTQLRPDQAPQLDGIALDAWLNQPAWRPMLAVMCHSRLVPVPDVPQRYRRRADEAPVDNLCGLWDVGPSTFYRYVERGQRAMARVAMEPPLVPRRLALRRFVLAELAAAGRWADDEVRVGWHRRQAEELVHHGDSVSALWHAVQARDAALAVQTLLTQAAMLAGEPEADSLVERVAALDLTVRERFDLWLARATLARTRQATEREETACRQALQLAEAHDDDLMRGVAYAALGRFHEARDVERALACYEDSLSYLRRRDPTQSRAEALGPAMNTLVRLAWVHVRRNHPGARALLDQATELQRKHGAPDELTAVLEQSWGAYWRIAGEPDLALQAGLRALNVFERIGDRRSVLSTYRNLMPLYAEARDIERLEACAQRIFNEAARQTIEPAILLGAHGNLAYGYSLVERYEPAIDQFRQALALALAAQRELDANLTRCNLANAYYYRFLETGDAAYERQGDEEVAKVLSAPETTVTASLVETARGLKAYVLGHKPEHSTDRLLDTESAAHLPEMSEIQRQRDLLSAPGGEPETHARARLTIARAYLTIAAKERDAAQALAEQHGLADQFAADFAALQDTFAPSPQHRLGAAWKKAAPDLLDDHARFAVIGHLLAEGAVNKSGYAQLCSVSPATASKHLALLAERGLLVQTGKGPSTRYTLP